MNAELDHGEMSLSAKRGDLAVQSSGDGGVERVVTVSLSLLILW
jgi:hypothetical protein